MSKEQQLIYLNDQITQTNTLITQKNQLRVNLEDAITQTQLNIVDLENQITLVDTDIENYNFNIQLLNAIIIIIEQSLKLEK